MPALAAVDQIYSQGKKETMGARKCSLPGENATSVLFFFFPFSPVTSRYGI
jgi:hypothetical protein